MRVLICLVDPEWQSITEAAKSRAAKTEHNLNTWTEDKIKKKPGDLGKGRKKEREREME